LDLSRRRFLLNDSSVGGANFTEATTLLLNPSRGDMAAHPSYVAKDQDRADVVEFLRGLRATEPHWSFADFASRRDERRRAAPIATPLPSQAGPRRQQNLLAHRLQIQIGKITEQQLILVRNILATELQRTNGQFE
jgi:hypothetical protein